jgi:DNA-binding MarR family transcriptional regulator
MDKTEEETRRNGLDEAADQIVAVLPRMFKTVMRQARDAETLRGAVTNDMGDAQIWTLHALMRGPQLASELARRSNVTNPTMTRIIDALVEKGFVERHPDPDDRRRIHLQLTATGSEIGTRVHECFRAALVSYLSPLSDTQLGDIRRAFAHLRSLIPHGDDWCKHQ